MRKVVAAILLVIDIAVMLWTFALMLSLIRLSLAAAHKLAPLSVAHASVMWVAVLALTVTAVALLLEFTALARLLEELARP
jgi:hypothetical protein